MKLFHFLLLCIASYTLWLMYDISKHGILHKERKETQQTLIRAQGLIDQLKVSVKDADHIVRDVQTDYQIKTKNFPKLLQALHHFVVVLSYGFVAIIGLGCIGIVKYILKN